MLTFFMSYILDLIELDMPANCYVAIVVNHWICIWTSLNLPIIAQDCCGVEYLEYGA